MNIEYSQRLIQIDPMDLNIVLNPMEVVEENGNLLLTNGTGTKLPLGKGFTITPQNVRISGIESGELYFDQKCIRHQQVITHNTKGTKSFDWLNRNLRDGNQFGHYDIFKIVNNSIQINPNHFHFYDAPYITLHENWNYLFYLLEFQTFINYSDGVSEVIRNCMQIQWGISAELERSPAGDWDLKMSHRYSDKLIHTLVQDGCGKPAEHVWEMPNLKTAVQSFWEEQDIYDLLA